MRDDERVVLELVKLRSRLPGDGDEEWLTQENTPVKWSRWGYDWERSERVDHGEDGRYSVYIDCSDVFAWGSADGEPVTMETLPTLWRTMDDVVELWRAEAEFSEKREAIERAAGLLYCARVRELRPQGAMYRHLPQVMWPLFDVAGPVREVGLLNPRPRPES